VSSARVVVLVEGESDRIALLTLAGRRGRDLTAEGVRVVAMGGITNTYTYVMRYAPGAMVLGLFDAAEEPRLRAALDRADLPGAGVFGCDPDLESELIRALGVPGVEALDLAAVPPPLDAVLEWSRA
jgi:hypothetical protein